METTATDSAAEIEAVEAQAAALRAEYERLDHALAEAGEWTPSDARRLEDLNDQAWRLEDQAETMRARYALQTIPGLAGLAVATLTPAPAGPDVLGSPMVWIDNLEYWADEVLALANH